MKSLNVIAATALAVSLSTATFAGTISGSRTNRVGTITGSKTGIISGSKAGTISGLKAGTIAGSNTGSFSPTSDYSGTTGPQETLNSKLAMLLIYLAW